MGLGSINDALNKRAEKLDLGRGDDLTIIQCEIDRIVPPGKAKAKSIKNGYVLVITPSAPLASELRMHAPSLLQNLKKQTHTEIKRLNIRIGQL